MKPMSVPLVFNLVNYPGILENFSREFSGGTSALLVSPREHACMLLTRLITGLAHPASGKVLIDGIDLATLEYDDLLKVRQQMAIVSPNGGLISNLKVWENLTLPLMYHRSSLNNEEERRALAHLEALGYTGNIMALPAHLSLHDRRIIALARAFMTDARIVVYQECFEGVSTQALPLFARLTASFHAERSDRVTLYLAATDRSADLLKPDCVIHVSDAVENK